jgi:hypothetical protein
LAIVDEPVPPDTTLLLPPTVADITAWSRVAFDELDNPYTDVDLSRMIARSCAYITAITGRLIDDSMPMPLVAIAQDAGQLKVEQEALQSQEDYVDTVTDDLIQSFTAGNYSETRKEPGRLRYTGATTGIPEINSNPTLNMDLWLLMTPAMQEYWRYVIQGSGGAAFAVTEVDWGNYDGLYPYSYGVGMARPFPDANTWGA